ncbi:MAG: DUF222 domain-containing protein [Nocardioidaceae bacterium]|nr:DUF222 domain-containing protein [Nocardioidaceae bacterium]
MRNPAEALASAPLPTDAAAIVEELRALEELKCVAEARQARLTVALQSLRTSEGDDSAVHAEVALARRISPYRGSQLLSLATVLARELPCTKAAFEAGLISQWRAQIIARETGCLSLEHRMQVDEAIAGDPAELSQRGDKETAALVQQHAARLDAAVLARRRRYAESARRVSIRPAPDSMVFLTTLLPTATGIGVYASLKAHATTAVGIGEATSIGTAMADELVRRVTGLTKDLPPPVALGMVMTTDALLEHGDEPLWIDGYGPATAEVGRALIADNLDAGAKVWLKRLFTRPETGELIAMDSRARLFPKALADFIGIRDRWCRTPWCDAPIRHRDHVKPHADGGATSAVNGQGLCEACNHAKQAAGWSSVTVPGPTHTVETTTPTGHRYRSRAPAA